jgi:Cu+-exporting ATPase
MKKIELRIEGMSCKHCAKKVENAINEVTGVKKAAVNLNKQKVVVNADDSITAEELIKIIEKTGYQGFAI